MMAMIFSDIKKSIKIILLSIIIVMQCACKSESEPVEIKLDLEEGKEYTQNMTSTITAKTLFSEMSMIMTVKMSFLIEKVSDTIYFAKAQYKKVAWTIQSNSFSETFDTENSDDSDFKLVGYKVFTNTPFYVALSKNGKVHYVDESETWEKIASSLAELQLSIEQKEEILILLKNMAKNLKNHIENIQLFFPDKSVIKGEKWKKQKESISYRNMIVTSEYQLIEVKEDYLTIKESVTVSVNKTQDVEMQSAIEEQNMRDLLEAGIIAGEIKIDRRTGWIIEANQIGTVTEKLDTLGLLAEVTKNVKITN